MLFPSTFYHDINFEFSVIINLICLSVIEILKWRETCGIYLYKVCHSRGNLLQFHTRQTMFLLFQSLPPLFLSGLLVYHVQMYTFVVKNKTRKKKWRVIVFKFDISAMYVKKFPNLCRLILVVTFSPFLWCFNMRKSTSLEYRERRYPVW